MPSFRIEVRACRAHRQEHEPALQIGGNRGPDIRGPGAGGSGLPGLGARVTLRGDGAKRPAELAGACVEGAHDPVWRLRAVDVGDRRADDDHVVDHRAGRREAELTLVDERLDAFVQMDVLEPLAALAGTGVQRDRYAGQRIFVVRREGYVCLVPFVEDEHIVFLKTIIPSRKGHEGTWKRFRSARWRKACRTRR